EICGYVFPVRSMDSGRVKEIQTTYEAVESCKGEDVPQLMSVKPHVLFKWLFQLGATPKLSGAVEDLVRPNILLTTCAIWPKDAGDQRFVTWHQDSAYIGYGPMDVWSAWIARTDSRVDNGCLQYLPGSHKDREMIHEETYNLQNMLSGGQKILPGQFKEIGAIDVELKSGKCMFHHFQLAHTSEPNNSDRQRIGILFVFCPTHVKPTTELNSAILVRSEDKFGYWNSGPIPESGLDAAHLRHYNDFWKSYVNPENIFEAERSAASK
ncbi:MAG: phytanoyl-CoA dioxygenase family protein, partial [Pseudomonadota bacterium]|nr:phytanoyl-CoA dioxygenase family protein [Pseudomonadota bacterium]